MTRKLNLGGVNKSGCSNRFQSSGRVLHCVLLSSHAVSCFVSMLEVKQFSSYLTSALGLSSRLIKFSRMSHYVLKGP